MPQPVYRLPELGSPWISKPLRVTVDLFVRPQTEPVQNNLARFLHDLLAGLDGIHYLTGGRLNQQGIVNRGTHADFRLSRQNAREPQHFSTVRLQRKITDFLCLGVGADVQSPSKDRLQPAMKECEVLHGARPFPIGRKGLPVQCQQFLSSLLGVSQPECQALGSYAVLYAQNTLFELLSLVRMTLLRCRRGHSTGLLGELKVGIARQVRLLHVDIA